MALVSYFDFPSCFIVRSYQGGVKKCLQEVREMYYFYLFFICFNYIKL